jgi:hypothetical protein
MVAQTHQNDYKVRNQSISQLLLFIDIFSNNKTNPCSKVHRKHMNAHTPTQILRGTSLGAVIDNS